MDRQEANNKIKNLKERLFAKKIDPEMAQIRTIFLVWQEFPMSWAELQDIPIPTFQFLVKLLDQQAEEMKKKQK